MIRAWQTLALSMALTACTQLPPMQSTSTDARQVAQHDVGTPPIGEHTLLLNPPGGSFMEFSHPAFVGRDYELELTLLRTNPHPQWGGIGSMCVLVKESSHKTCIRFGVRPGAQDIIVETALSKDAQRISSSPMPGTFRLGEPIPVRTEVLAQGVQVTIGKEAPQMIPVEGTIDKMSFLCSSALCRFWLK